MSGLSDEERQIIMMIEAIQRDYQKQIDPLLKQLALIRSLQPPPPIIIEAGAAKVMFHHDDTDSKS